MPGFGAPDLDAHIEVCIFPPTLFMSQIVIIGIGKHEVVENFDCKDLIEDITPPPPPPPNQISSVFTGSRGGGGGGGGGSPSQVRVSHCIHCGCVIACRMCERHGVTRVLDKHIHPAHTFPPPP